MNETERLRRMNTPLQIEKYLKDCDDKSSPLYEQRFWLKSGLSTINGYFIKHGELPYKLLVGTLQYDYMYSAMVEVFPDSIQDNGDVVFHGILIESNYNIKDWGVLAVGSIKSY